MALEELRSAQAAASGPAEEGVRVFYEEVSVGMDIPDVARTPNRRQLVQWSGASENFAPIHFDDDLARRGGLPAVNIHGRLKAAFLAEMLTRWAGSFSALKKLGVSYRKMDFPDAVMTCKARVSGKRIENGQGIVGLDIRIENDAGESTTLGTAVLHLPFRAGA